jgi:hypothetical protein
MPTIVLPICHNTDKPGWRTFYNEWCYEAGGALDFQAQFYEMQQLLYFHKAIHLTSTHMLGIAAFDITTKQGWFWNFIEENKQGAWPQTAPPLYRYNLALTFYMNIGIPRHKWLRGCVDAADFSIHEKDAIRHEKYRARADILDLVMNRPNPIMQETLVASPQVARGFPAQGYERPESVQIGPIVDSHATTRWRRRVKGAGPDLGESIAYTLSRAARHWEEGFGAMIIAEDVIHNRLYLQDVGNFGAFENIGKNILKWCDEAKNDPNNNGNSPNSRFGFTFEEIGTTYKTVGEAARKAAEEFDKTLKPYDDGTGKMFRKRKDFEPYHDQLTKVIKACTFGIYADWFNPNAIEGQTAPDTYEGQLDAVELAL